MCETDAKHAKSAQLLPLPLSTHDSQRTKETDKHDKLTKESKVGKLAQIWTHGKQKRILCSTLRISRYQAAIKSAYKSAPIAE